MDRMDLCYSTKTLSSIFVHVNSLKFGMFKHVLHQQGETQHLLHSTCSS